jgi:hypothetical protein
VIFKGKFVQEDTLRNRKRLGPLGWIVVSIATLFVLACGLGAFTLLTHNVSRLQAEADATQPMAANQVTLTTSSITVTPTLSLSPPITWTVWLAKDPLGQTIYDGPVAIKLWVLRDYAAAQGWFNTHLLEKDFLLAHLDEYYTGKALGEGRGNIASAFDETHIIMAPSSAQPRQPAPMDQPVFVTFTPDGRQMRLNDYTDVGAAKQYDTRTRKPMAVSLKNKFLWQYLMEYDASSGRWKVARNTEIINIDTNTLVLSDEP